MEKNSSNCINPESSQDNRIYKTGGVSPTLGKSSSMNQIKIIANTKEGEETAEPGYSINLSMPNSKTRRGRIGKGVAQTLDTQSNQVVVCYNSEMPQDQRVYDANGVSPTLQGKTENGGYKVPKIFTPQQDRLYSDEGLAPCLSKGNGGNLVPKIVAQRGRNIVEGKRNDYKGAPTIQRIETNPNNIANTLTSVQKDNMVLENTNIRRLTEIECERLQGFKDNHTQYGIYEKQVWINKKEKTFEVVEQKHKIPKSQRYKLCGNAVTVNVVELIVRKLKINGSL